MNFYDKVHEMIRSFKEMGDYKEYINLKNSIKQDSKKSKMLREFKTKQQTHQMEFLNSGKLEEEHKKELENLYSILIHDEDIRKFLEYEMKLDVYLADMQKIIGEGINELLEV